jgi:hypothetical protein
MTVGLRAPLIGPDPAPLPALLPPAGPHHQFELRVTRLTGAFAFRRILRTDAPARHSVAAGDRGGARQLSAGEGLACSLTALGSQKQNAPAGLTRGSIGRALLREPAGHVRASWSKVDSGHAPERALWGAPCGRPRPRQSSGPRPSDHPATSLGPRCVIANRHRGKFPRKNYG